jgi:hypothetical protein
VGSFQSTLAALLAAAATVFSSCFAELKSTLFETAPSFLSPEPSQLSQVGTVPAAILLPEGYVAGSLAVTLDGADVSASFRVEGAVARANVAVADVGAHALEAQVQVQTAAGATTDGAQVEFQTVDWPDADRCEVLNQLACLLPYPSSRFLAPADTATGVRVEFPAEGMPEFFNFDLRKRTQLDPAPFRALDGYSPAAQVLMHFPGGVDLGQSNVPQLLSDTRSTDLVSLAPDSATILLDADTGERALHWVELDSRAIDRNGDPLDSQLLFLRPGAHLRAGHRYVVAVRSLVHRDGTPVEAEPAFAALRDGTATTIPAIESRRAEFARILGDLRGAGLSEDEIGALQLAFEFRVASVENTTGELLSMRDQAFAWLASQSGPTFAVDSSRSEEHDCSEPGQAVWRVVRGTFQSPLFLTDDPGARPRNVGFLRLDANGVPQSSGTEAAPFSIGIPCAARVASDLRTVLIGHGLGQSGTEIIDLLIGALAELNVSLPGVIGATDWHGLAGPDFDRVLQLEGFLGSIFRDFDRFRALPDRLRQAQVNTLVLARMMRDGAFNIDPWFQREDGGGVFPGRTEPLHYYGVSLGGIMGTLLGATTPDIERMNVDVGASNFSMLLSRATPFRDLEDLLLAISQPNVTTQALALSMLGELWTRGEPAGYAAHVTGLNQPLLPGSIAKKILMTVARFDHQVSNQASEIMARTLGIPSLIGSAEFGKPLIPDLPGPLASALVYYDAGGLVPGIHDDYIPPLENRRVFIDQCDPHSDRLRTPASLDQLFAFLDANGSIENFCDGRCDGKDARGDDFPYEIPGGAAHACVP